MKFHQSFCGFPAMGGSVISARSRLFQATMLNDKQIRYHRRLGCARISDTRGGGGLDRDEGNTGHMRRSLERR